VDEREGVANPLGEGGAGSTEGAGEIGDKLKAEAEVDGEAAAEAGTRRSGRARARVAAEAEEPIKVEGNGKGKLKRELSSRVVPSTAHEEQSFHSAEEAEDSEPRLTTATTNAPHARFTQPGDHNLLEYDGAPCSATLNLTDLKKNSNKVPSIKLGFDILDRPDTECGWCLLSFTLSRRSAPRRRRSRRPSSPSSTGAGWENWDERIVSAHSAQHRRRLISSWTRFVIFKPSCCALQLIRVRIGFSSASKLGSTGTKGPTRPCGVSHMRVSSLDF